jgi:hypothetical protein
MSLAQHEPSNVVVPGERTPTSLRLPEGLAFEDWLDMGRPLLAAAESVQWWVGDWLTYGERAYGAQYTAAAEETQLDPGTLANLAWVAQSVPPDRRRPSLTWSHHRAVAALDADQQDRLLDEATSASWPKRDLEAAVRRVRGGDTAPPPPPAQPATVATVEVSAPRIVVRGETAHAEMLRAVTDAAGDQLRDTAEDLAARLRQHLADAGVSAAVEVR